MNRHMRMKLSLFLSFILLTGVILCGCSSDPKNFTVAGMTITLTKDFEVGNANSFDIYLKSDEVIFTAVVETADELEQQGYEINNLDDYTSEILALNNTSKSNLVSKGKYRYFTTTNTVNGANYTYVHCTFQNGTSYWVCEFACKTKHYDKYKEKIIKWADSISFSN